MMKSIKRIPYKKLISIMLSFLLLFSITGIGTVSSNAESTIIYVQEGANGDGTSWANAFGTLQQALDVVVAGQQIWVAKGTYYPTSDYGLDPSEGSTPGSPRNMHFQMKNGVAIYGGFAGNEAQDFDLGKRDFFTNETILSGDIGVLGDNSDNSYHVFYHPDGTNLDSSAILDGVAIIGGNADVSWMSGGGMYNLNSSPTLTNLVFAYNNSGHSGGGLYNTGNGSIISDVMFIHNTSNFGGGMYNEFGNSILTNVRFVENIARQSGGGTSNQNSDKGPTYINVTFENNKAIGWSAGGMFNSAANPLLINVAFNKNSAGIGGGGLYNTGSEPALINVTFSGNSAGQDGGAIYNYFRSNITLINTVLWGNSSGNSTELFNNTSDDTANISYSLIKGSGGSGVNWASSLGIDGGGNIDADPLFIDADNGNLRLQAGSPAINAGTNTPFLPGAIADGITTDIDGNVRIVNDTVDMGAYEYQGMIEPGLESITHILKDRDDLTTLLAALETAELDEALEGEGPFTLFAPNNEAFAALLDELKIEAGDLLEDENLTSILLYHVAGEKLLEEDLEDGMEIETLNGQKLMIKFGSILVNEATVIEADIEANNGVIHIIDLVLLPVTEDDDDDEQDLVADAVMWLPPVSLEKFTVNNGSTLPIKFALLDSEGTVLSHEQTVTLAVYGPNNETIVSWAVKDGLTFEYEEEVSWFYRANFHTRNFELAEGEYKAVVYGIEEEKFGEIYFIIETANRNNRGLD